MKPDISFYIISNPIIQIIITILIAIILYLIITFCLKPLSNKLNKDNKNKYNKYIYSILAIFFLIITIVISISIYKNPFIGYGNYHIEETFVVGTDSDTIKKSNITLINKGEDKPYQVPVTTKQVQFIYEGQKLEIKTEHKELIRKNDKDGLHLNHFKKHPRDVEFRVINSEKPHKWIKSDEKG